MGMCEGLEYNVCVVCYRKSLVLWLKVFSMSVCELFFEEKTFYK